FSDKWNLTGRNTVNKNPYFVLGKSIPMKQLYSTRKFLPALSILCFFFFAKTGNAQVFWTEDFGLDNNCTSQNMQVTSYTGVNGAWTQSLPTANGTSANDWDVSATE